MTEEIKKEPIAIAAEDFTKIDDMQKQFVAGFMVGVLSSKKETKKIS